MVKAKYEATSKEKELLEVICQSDSVTIHLTSYSLESLVFPE